MRGLRANREAGQPDGLLVNVACDGFLAGTAAGVCVHWESVPENALGA